MVTRQRITSVWLLFVVMVWLGGTLWIAGPPPNLIGDERWVVALLLLVPTFVAIEWWPLTVEHRGETMHLTLSGVGVLVGLFFLGPLPTLASRLVGSLVGLAVRWHNPPPKLAVNGASMVLEVWVCATILGLIAQMASVASPAAWGAVVLAALGGEATTSLSVLAAVRITVGPLRRGALPPLAAGVMSSAALVSVFTVLTINLLAIDLWLGVVVAATMVLLVGTNRRRHDLDLRHQRLRSLYHFMTAVEASPDGAQRLEAILREANEVLGTQHATLLMVEGGDAVRVRMDGDRLDITPASRDVVETLTIASGEGLLVPSRRVRGPGLDDELGGLPGVVASLAHADVIGVLVLRGRRGNMPALDEDDLGLATAIASHAGTALAEVRLLERLRLERARIEELGLVDRATGLRNRAGLLRDMPVLARGAVLVVGFRGLDRLALWLGHAVAERVAVAAAHRLRDIAVSRDATVAALGEGTFALIDPGTHDVRQAAELSRQVVWGVEGPVEDGPLSLELIPTVGIAMAPDHGTDVAELLREAGNALEQAADKGLQVCWFDADYDRETQRRLQMASDLRWALDRDEITVAYQPKVDLRTGRVTGVEALARWRHDALDVAPQDFVDVAERTGLIRELTMHIARQALIDAEGWRREGLELSIALNMSLSLTQDASIARDITDLVATAGVPADRIVVEITESQVMEDIRRGRGVLGVFVRAGMQLSIDDFGTGYSSMSTLKSLPVQELKIDRSFVTNIVSDPTDRAIVQAVVRLGSDLGLSIVAEGVEDAATRDLLTELGCDVAQGYLFSRPLPGASVPAAVRVIDLAKATEPSLLGGPQGALGSGSPADQPVRRHPWTSPPATG